MSESVMPRYRPNYLPLQRLTLLADGVVGPWIDTLGFMRRGVLWMVLRAKIQLLHERELCMQ